jgi:hypothetical protein
MPRKKETYHRRDRRAFLQEIIHSLAANTLAKVIDSASRQLDEI